MEEFSSLKKEIDEKERARDELIVNSRPVIKESKNAIYAIHRDDMKTADKHLKSAKAALRALKDDTGIGAYCAALQEYTEAATYYDFIKKGELTGHKEIGVDPENYLLGLCDLTGELGRKAVFSVVKEDYAMVPKIQEFVDLIYNNIMQFEFSNGELRRKSDSIKYNLKKIEEIMYDLKIRGKI